MLKQFGIGLTMMLLAVPAMAQWELDSKQSSLNFISIKNNAIAETHSFSSLMGYVSADGNAQVSVNLDSVQTLIPIRNERMREMLFDTDSFPTATVSAAIDPAILEVVSEGGSVSTELSLKLSLHGIEKALPAAVLVIGEGSRLRVVTRRPIVLSAADFGLDGGLQALREVAGLKSISTAVPVTFSLQFDFVE